MVKSPVEWNYCMKKLDSSWHMKGKSEKWGRVSAYSMQEADDTQGPDTGSRLLAIRSILGSWEGGEGG